MDSTFEQELTMDNKASNFVMQYRSFRAPQEDRAVLVDPAWEHFPALFSENLARKQKTGIELPDYDFAQFVRIARSEVLKAAIKWTGRYRDTSVLCQAEEAPVLMAGHQPILFHPGVWFKNCALSSLAQQCRAWAVNLIIDSDTLKSAQVPVPTGTETDARLTSVLLDKPGEPLPFEHRSVFDQQLFATFPQRVKEQLGRLVADPLLDQYWPLVCEMAAQTNRLGYAIAQARHQYEERFGWQTLEIPQSIVCSLPSHLYFALLLLTQSHRLHQIYNDALEEYRRVHKIRSKAQPAPNLERMNEWLEMPFWIWTDDTPTRRRLFVRRTGTRLELSDGGNLTLQLEIPKNGSLLEGVEKLQTALNQGVRLRCRAFITTLFARLVLSDLFIHGIGGAKYDQVTDAIMARFFGVDPPGYMTLSATVLLPVKQPKVTIDDLRRIKQQLWQLKFHAERFVDPGTIKDAEKRRLFESLVQEKRHWIHTEQTPENARQRYLAFRRINQALQEFVEERRQQLLEQLEAVDRQLELKKVLGWREYPFCIYPHHVLEEFFAGCQRTIASSLAMESCSAKRP